MQREIGLKNTIDAQYPPAPAGGFVHKLVQSQRRRLAAAFANFVEPAANGTVLYVGIDSAGQAADQAPLDVPNSLRVTHYTVDVPGHAARRTSPADRPHDVVHLPFADGQFDWTICPEVIEHVPSYERQYALVKELARVSRRGAFITTSNRRHPLEFNTGVPFLHWLPAAWWRRTLRWLGRDRFAAEAPLHLLDSKALYNFAMLLPGKPAHDVGHKRVAGLKAHFFLMIEKGKPAAQPEAKAGGKPGK